MSKTEELAKWLREHCGCHVGPNRICSGESRCARYYKAADHIEAQQAIIDELVGALGPITALAETKVYPQPDKPDSDWAKVKAAQAVLNRAKGDTE